QRYSDHRDLTSFPTRRSSDLAKGNANALVTLQENMRKEIDAVNAKWDAKELEDGRKIMEERQKRLAEQGKKNVEQIKKDAIAETDRKSTRLNSSHVKISYAVF